MKSNRWDQMITFGARPALWNEPATWPDSVRAAFDRVVSFAEGSESALPELLEADLEFIRDRRVFGALMGLRYTRSVRADSLREKIARILTRPHGDRRGGDHGRPPLPPGDALYEAFVQWAAWIEQADLSARFRKSRGTPACGSNTRSARSWALRLIASDLHAEEKSIEEAIRRFYNSDSRRFTAEERDPKRFGRDVQNARAGLARQVIQRRIERGEPVSIAERRAAEEGVRGEEFIRAFRDRAARPSEYGPGLEPVVIEAEVAKTTERRSWPRAQVYWEGEPDPAGWIRCQPV